MEVVAAIQASIEIVGKLRELAKKVQNAELKMLLADLSNELADAKLNAASLKTELANAREEAEQLRQQLSQRTSATPRFEDGAYRFDGDDGHFCTGCWDVHQKKVRLAEHTGAFKAFGRWNCPSCQAHFG